MSKTTRPRLPSWAWPTSKPLPRCTSCGTPTANFKSRRCVECLKGEPK